jgi:chorismate-pyruvate lyase
VNPLRELEELAGLFPEPAEQPLYLRADHVAKEATPEPYHHMLVHEHHMTVSMESWYQCRVDVSVLDSRFEDGLYLRKIVLLKSGTAQPVQFGCVRFNLELVTPQVRQEILEEKTPLGRVLIQHNVFRHVDLGAILRFTAGPGLQRYLHMQPEEVTYGRLATIFCNGTPAIDLLEIAAPLSR